jgi:ribosomal protein S18 acetylase RimI-like enzyme
MKPVVRTATPADLADIERIIADAFTPYIGRIGRAPAPMTADYARLVRDTEDVHVVLVDGDSVGVLVTADEPDHVFVDTIAVSPAHLGRGFGRILLDVAEARARARGCAEVRLYTNAAMTENLALYPHLGYVEVGRRVDDGFQRVFFVKTLT